MGSRARGAGGAVPASRPAPSEQAAEASRAAEWVERAARFGYAAKGLVYIVIGGLAIKQALGDGDVGGTREAMHEIVGAPLGRAALAVVTIGLAGYVAWRLVQAVLDPEGRRSGKDGPRRWAMRVFYLGSAGVYGVLAYHGVTLLVAGLPAAPADSRWAADVMRVAWGAWIVGAIGVGIAGRALFQFAKAWNQDFMDRIASHEVDEAQRRWIAWISRLGLVARGIVFGLIAGTVVSAGVVGDPGRARGLEGALEMLIVQPWLLGALGVGLVAYAIYQWSKARYRLIGLP